MEADQSRRPDLRSWPATEVLKFAVPGETTLQLGGKSTTAAAGPRYHDAAPTLSGPSPGSEAMPPRQPINPEPSRRFTKDQERARNAYRLVQPLCAACLETRNAGNNTVPRKS